MQLRHGPIFPTEEHARVAETVAEYAQQFASLDTVLVVNSCARGNAVAASDLDMAILLTTPVDEDEMDIVWRNHVRETPVLAAFCERSDYSAVHVDFFDGTFTPTEWDDGGGPDGFELEIGNRVAYSVPFGPAGPYYEGLRGQWLPYYEAPLRESRLAMVREGVRRDLTHIPFYVSRDLHLQAFDRLYRALGQYLQALFISVSTYPIAYNKWLAEQLGMIGREDLYQPLLSVLEMNSVEKDVGGKARLLSNLEAEL